MMRGEIRGSADLEEPEAVGAAEGGGDEKSSGGKS
jgi:hypothetical protein